MLTLSGRTLAEKKESAQTDARELFDKVFNMVFGPEGSSFTYSVNIVGLYKTQGDAVYKDKKITYNESRFAAWEDGKVAYMVDRKEKKVAMFKYDVNNFAYSYKDKGEYYELMAKVKNSKFFGIRYVTALIRKDNLHPVSLSVKLAFITTTVQITNFRSGGIDDSVFVFPRNKFSDYKYVDHRGKN